jgi:hypothetical protein
MAQNLTAYLEGKSCKAFKPAPHYFSTGDYLTYFFKNDRCVAERLDDLLTVYVSPVTKELVGCKIKGIRELFRSLRSFGVVVSDGKVRLGLFFMLATKFTREHERRERYKELERLASDAEVDGELLEAV